MNVGTCDKKTMQISVIVPVYNVRPYLEEAVESLLQQTHTDLEIILVDDGSTDGSGTVCDRYAERDGRIRIIHQSNKGLSGARNAGLDIMTGDAVAFLDPDDAFHGDMLRRMLEAIQSNGADMAECNYTVFRTADRMDPKKLDGRTHMLSRKEGLYHRREALRMQLSNQIAACVWNKLYRSALWDGLRFREGQNYEDIDIILPLLGKADRVSILNDSLVMHRKRPGSITAKKTPDNVRDRALAYRHYVDYVRSGTEEYFDTGCLKTATEKRVASLLVDYLACCRGTGTDKTKSIAFLKGELDDAERDVDIKECSMNIRVGHFLYSKMPMAVSGLAFQMLVPFWRRLRRVFSR